MGARERHPGARVSLMVAAVLSAVLLGVTGGWSFVAWGGSASMEENEAGRAMFVEGPTARMTPDGLQPAGRRGAAMDSSWTTPPAGGDPRSEETCFYDNGAPLEDLGDPASQLSEEPAPLLWQFIAGAADDFELVDYVAPQTSCQISTVRAAFNFYWGGYETATPKDTWDGVFVTVYANAEPGSPDGFPDENGNPSNFVATQYVPASELQDQIQTELGTCWTNWQIDIPVDPDIFSLAKNTRYWLSLIPHFPGPPQSYWCISEQAGQGHPGQQGFPNEGIFFWTEIYGNNNHSYCAAQEPPPAGTNKDLSFILFGQEMPPNFGACCDTSTGFCTDVNDPANCIGQYEIFYPRTTCASVDCQIITGACCDDSTGICSVVGLADCQGPNQRFAPGVDDCLDLDPPCGTTEVGACCFFTTSAVGTGQAAADQVSQASYIDFMDNWLYTHAGDDRGFGLEHDLARDNIEFILNSYGLTVTLEPFDYLSTTYYNVVGTKVGTAFPNQEYIIGAHYDSLNNPGADDDASGVALVLEAARIVSQYDSDYTIRFIGFDREEQGKVGSSAYVAAHLSDDILGMVQLDMVAYDPNTNLAFIYQQPASPVAAALGAAVDSYGNGLAWFDDGWNGQSDHASFDAAGFDACLLIESEVWNNPYYHTPQDSFEQAGNLNFPFAVKMTRSVVGWLVDAAGVQVTGGSQTRDCEDLPPTECVQAGGEWHVETCAAFDCPPDNDDCEAAWFISGDGLIAFDTIGATTDGPADSPGGDCTDVNQDVWFKYIAPCTGSLTASLCFETNYDAALAIYEGCLCLPDLGPQIGCDDDACGVDGAGEVTVPVVDGGCYLLRIGGDGAATGSGHLIFGCLPQDTGSCCLPDGDCLVVYEADCTALDGVFALGEPCSPISCPPPNDDCVDSIAVGDGLYAFDTRGATTDGPLGEPGCINVNQDIWFDYTATCDGSMTASLCFGTSYDSALSVYGDCACPPSGPPLACNNDSCDLASEVVLDVTEGTCYKVRVGGIGSASGPGNLVLGCVPPNHGACCLPDGTCQVLTVIDCWSLDGTFTFGKPCSPLTCPPPNDLCVEAIPISDGSHPFDTRGADTDGPADSPGGHCTNVNQDVWFEYTATCDGTMVASLCLDTDYDAALAVYEGCATCPPTLLVGCDDDGCAPGGPGEVEIQVTTGTCYLIRVGGAGGAWGSGSLTVDCLPPDTGACCHANYTCELLLATQCIAPDDVFSWSEPCSQLTCPPPPISCCPGDANGDDILSGDDIRHFIDLLLDPPEVGTIPFCWANVNDEDLVIDLADLPPFVQRLLDGEPCPVPGLGACCFGDGTCGVLSWSACVFQGGLYQGDDTVCNPSPCLQPSAACCFQDGSCQELEGDVCSAAGGLYQGPGSTCDPNSCPQPPVECCPGDLDLDGYITVLDAPLLVAALLAPPQDPTEICLADVDGDQVIDGRDIGPFIGKVLSQETCGLANDNCQDAIEIACNSQITVDNTSGTTDPSDPAFSCRSGGPAQGVGTVWFKFHTDTETDALISLCNTASPVEDTLLAVYDGTCLLTEANEIACSEDGAGLCDRLSEVCVTGLTPGTEYYIQVASFDEDHQGMITIDLICPCPTGACCFDDGQCLELRQADCAGAGGYYQGDGSVCDSSTCPTGACCFDDGTCQVLLDEACLSASGSYAGDDTTCEATPCPPANDACQDARMILCNTQVTVDNTSAVTDPTDPEFGCHFGGQAQGVGAMWFQFQATQTTAEISTCSSQPPVSDTVIAVYDSTGSCPFAVGDEIGCSEDACGRLSEVCVADLTPGEIYYVQVASFSENERGPITVDLTCPCPGP